MAKKFTRRFDPDGPRNSEAELSEYDHLTRSPVVDPNIADWSTQWTVDPHVADMNATEAEHARAKRGFSSGSVITVAGGSAHEIYHLVASCSVLTADLAMARLGNPDARIESRTLSAARRTGIACILCLPEVARSRGDYSRMKACTAATAAGARDGVLLHWRRDAHNEWLGLVVYDGDPMECDVVHASRLEERTVAAGSLTPTALPNSAPPSVRARKGSDREAPHDLASARRHHERSAAAGNTDAMRELGLLLAYRTDPRDLAGARHWWGVAAADGDRSAMYHLARLHAGLLDPPDIAEAREWYERAAGHGDVDAMRELGTLLIEKADEPDVEAAIDWWEKAASAGDHQSMMELGRLLGFRLAQPNFERARHWLTKAAEAGYLYAMANLGILLAYRMDPPDLDTARRWLGRAAGEGVPEAMVSLGFLLAYRIEAPDRQKARDWFVLAAAAGNAAGHRCLADLVGDASRTGSDLSLS
ncbi:tetratricopeptide repeat protein [Rhodococcus coprophilus]|uniref:tetratricopeptide repeat protein n=1 Tax=Rhodococcus coprophilus TaxID=38310 RepID=UPI00342E3D5F